MERAGEQATEQDDATDGPGSVSVDEPTEPALNPEDEDLQGSDGADGAEGGDGA